MEKEKILTNTLQEPLANEMDYAMIGISQDEKEILVADYRSNWVDEEQFLHRPLITNYQDERSSYQQLMDWLEVALPHLPHPFEEVESTSFPQEMLNEVNRELARNHQALLVRTIDCIDGTRDILALVYDPTREEKSDLEYYLKHHVEALYQGRVIQLYQVPIQEIYEKDDISELFFEATPGFIDQDLLTGDEKAVLRELHRLGFTSIQELALETEVQEEKTHYQDLERGL
ncbi:TPA: hypothetical protein U1C34_002020 [Streptococcus suis]|nr:hypothetical protein [Streptococcus suis]HEM3623199.1 hypothetical protein [Streptococcus suis]HEM3627328.1 hypothetical protein [Streptococcus suis]HEM3631978.1 hypothetical protein [Streptococcus suis]HEM3640576.1 hypothetical protein [Streptococcus suis]